MQIGDIERIASRIASLRVLPRELIQLKNSLSAVSVLKAALESSDVDKVENISREISALIAQGISIEAYSPSYYYTKLDDVKLSLIEQASADARARAEKIADNAGTSIGRVASAKMGVFQITGANSNEEFSAGGSFNTSSRQKKARITMKVEYRVR